MEKEKGQKFEAMVLGHVISTEGATKVAQVERHPEGHPNWGRETLWKSPNGVWFVVAEGWAPGRAFAASVKALRSGGVPDLSGWDITVLSASQVLAWFEKRRISMDIVRAHFELAPLRREHLRVTSGA